eukprot:1840481-Karenia_brevis.AAC.1
MSLQNGVPSSLPSLEADLLQFCTDQSLPSHRGPGDITMQPANTNERKANSDEQYVTGSALQSIITQFGANMQNGFSALLQSSTQTMLGQVSQMVDAKLDERLAPMQQSIESANKEIEYLKQQSLLFNLKIAQIEARATKHDKHFEQVDTQLAAEPPGEPVNDAAYDRPTRQGVLQINSEEL